MDQYDQFDLRAVQKRLPEDPVGGPVMMFLESRLFRGRVFFVAAYVGLLFLVIVPLIGREYEGRIGRIPWGITKMLVHPVEAAHRVLPPSFADVVDLWALCLTPGVPPPKARFTSGTKPPGK